MTHHHFCPSCNEAKSCEMDCSITDDAAFNKQTKFAGVPFGAPTKCDDCRAKPAEPEGEEALAELIQSERYLREKNSEYMGRLSKAQHVHLPSMSPPCKPGCQVCSALWCPNGDENHYAAGGIDGCPSCKAMRVADAVLKADGIPQTDRKVHLRIQVSDASMVKQRFDAMNEAQAELKTENQRLRQALQSKEEECLAAEKAMLAAAQQRDAALAESARRYDCHAGPGTTESACNACVTCLLRDLEAVGQKLVDWRIRYAVLAWGPEVAARIKQPHDDRRCLACSHPAHLITATDGEDPFKSSQTYILDLLGSPGVVRILIERFRQKNKEGWTPEHDAQHVDGELSMAAACYAAPVQILIKDGDFIVDAWPWGAKDDKRSKHSRIRRLEIAGALIAAQLDTMLPEHIRRMADPCTVCGAGNGVPCSNGKHDEAKVPLGEFDADRSEQKMARLPKAKPVDLDETPDWAKSQS